MFLIRLMFSPVRIFLFAARIIGYSRMAMFLLGVAVGLLLAPTTGAELRAQLRERAAQRRGAVAVGSMSDPSSPLTANA